MLQDGWNIKRLKPRDGAEQGTAYIQVSVGFKGRPPRMVMITSRGRVELGEDTPAGRLAEVLADQHYEPAEDGRPLALDGFG